MDKKVLIIYYSQTGQLKDIVSQFSAPFIEKGIKLDIESINLTEPYSFPWTSKRFFDVMPESVLGISKSVESFKSTESFYDLIIFAYQPWFLSPSIPANSLFKHPDFIKIINGKNVVTLIGSRNMWISAQEKVKLLLKEAGANLVGNIVLIDKHTNLASAVSILHWMLNGKKDKFLGVFPTPGISALDINQSKDFGEIVSSRVLNNDYLNLQNELVEKGAVDVKSNLMFIEPRASKLFAIWANIIIKKRNRSLWLTLFKYYLVFALFIVSPIVLMINSCFFKPFLSRKIAEKKLYYLGIGKK